MKRVKFFVGNIFKIEEQINCFLQSELITLKDIKIEGDDARMVALVIYEI